MADGPLSPAAAVADRPRDPLPDASQSPPPFPAGGGRPSPSAPTTKDRVNRWAPMASAGPASLPAVSGHTAVVHRGRAVLFGGIADHEPYVNDVWVYDLATGRCWHEECPDPKPPGVFGHSATLIPGLAVRSSPTPGDVMLIHGGKEGATAVSHQTFALDLAADPPRWQKVFRSWRGAPAPRRWGHTALLLPDIPATPAWQAVHRTGCQRGVLMFAGDTGSAMCNDLFFFDPTTAIWTPLQASGAELPGPRRRHCAGLHRGCMYIFGGRGPSHCLQDTWRLHLATLCWQRVDAKGSVPMMRTGHTCVWDGGRMVVFGGFEFFSSYAALHGDAVEFDPDREHWAVLDTEESPVPLPPHNHEAIPDCGALPASVDAPALLRACQRPYPRTMAVAVVHAGRMYIHGGRDRARTFACAFYLPLRPRHDTLTGFVMQYLVDRGVEPEAGALPDTLARRLQQLAQS